MNFQMFQLDLKKAEEPGIKLPTSIGSLKKQESSRKTSTSALLSTPKPLTVWITTNCGKFLKGVHQGCMLSPCLFNLYATSCEKPGWMKHELESRLPGEISIISDMQMTPMTKSEELEPLDEGVE